MKMVKRWFKILAGVCVVVIGLILIPFPGPGGTPVTLAGLAILATELPFASRLKERLLALRAQHFEKKSPLQRFALIGAVLAVYTVMTTAAWWVWASNKA